VTRQRRSIDDATDYASVEPGAVGEEVSAARDDGREILYGGNAERLSCSQEIRVFRLYTLDECIGSHCDCEMRFVLAT